MRNINLLLKIYLNNIELLIVLTHKKVSHKLLKRLFFKAFPGLNLIKKFKFVCGILKKNQRKVKNI